MIIGIDGNEANVSNRVGVGQYSFQILKEFSKTKKHKFVVYLKSKPLSDLPGESENFKYKVVGPSKMWTQLGLPLRLLFQKIDVFYTPSHYAPRFAKVPVAITIHDLSYLFFPDLFDKKDLYQLENWTRYSVNLAKLIISVSASTRNDIIKEYKANPEKVVVTYEGMKPETVSKNFSMEDLKNKYGLKNDFVLFVGTLQPRKNIIKLIEAFSKLKNKKIDLVIIGKKGWQYEPILEAPREFGIEDRVKFLDFVPDEDLASFYKNAKVYCLPSLYEGFGLPVLEAMNYGCPVVTSNTSSLPEVGGDAAIYINPEDTDDIANKLDKVLIDDKLRLEMIRKGKEQVKKFSWEKTAKETLSALERLVEE